MGYEVPPTPPSYNQATALDAGDVITNIPQKPPPLMNRIIKNENWNECPICKSSFYRYWEWFFVIPWYVKTDKCIQPQCPNKHPNIESYYRDNSYPLLKITPTDIKPQPELGDRALDI